MSGGFWAMCNASSKTGSTRTGAGARIVLALAAASLLGGCAWQKRDSVTVGAVPDDYRTNHPIVIAEKDETLDLPVSATARGATASQRASLEGFLAGYDKTAAPTLYIVKPMGSPNAVAAAETASDFAHIAKQDGIPAARIMISTYQASAQEVSAPVRVTFSAMRAQTDKCGRWPEDVLQTSENKHYANFGCSYQNNIAAQIANPADLLGPRKQTPIDAANREGVIADYQAGDNDIDQNIDF